MNAETAIKREVSEAHRRASDEIDRWRGRCVRHYAKLEQAIAALVLQRRPDLKEPGFGLGCRLKQLSSIAETLPSDDRKKLTGRIKQFETAKDGRSAIVHGDGCIYVDPNGNWLWDVHFFRSGEKQPTHEVFRQADAAAFEQKLSRDVQSLCDKLKSLKAG